MLLHVIAMAAHRFVTLHLPTRETRGRIVRDLVKWLDLALVVVIAMLMVALVFAPTR